MSKLPKLRAASIYEACKSKGGLTKDQAEEIAHRCDCHDGLVAALEEIANIFPEKDMAEMDAADFTDRANRIFNAAKQAEAALAKYKEIEK